MTNHPPEGFVRETIPSVGGEQEFRSPNENGNTTHQYKSKVIAHKHLLELSVIGDQLGRKKDNMIRIMLHCNYNTPIKGLRLELWHLHFSESQ